MQISLLLLMHWFNLLNLFRIYCFDYYQDMSKISKSFAQVQQDIISVAESQKLIQDEPLITSEQLNHGFLLAKTHSLDDKDNKESFILRKGSLNQIISESTEETIKKSEKVIFLNICDLKRKVLSLQKQIEAFYQFENFVQKGIKSSIQLLFKQILTELNEPIYFQAKGYQKLKQEFLQIKRENETLKVDILRYQAYKKKMKSFSNQSSIPIQFSYQSDFLLVPNMMKRFLSQDSNQLSGSPLLKKQSSWDIQSRLDQSLIKNNKASRFDRQGLEYNFSSQMSQVQTVQSRTLKEERSISINIISQDNIMQNSTNISDEADLIGDLENSESFQRKYQQSYSQFKKEILSHFY